MEIFWTFSTGARQLSRRRTEEFLKILQTTFSKISSQIFCHDRVFSKPIYVKISTQIFTFITEYSTDQSTWKFPHKFSLSWPNALQTYLRRNFHTNFLCQDRMFYKPIYVEISTQIFSVMTECSTNLSKWKFPHKFSLS